MNLNLLPFILKILKVITTLLILIFGVLNQEVRGFEIPKSVETFFENHCFDCHGDGSDEGGLKLDELKFNLDSPAHFQKWELIYDRVKDQEMPPKKAHKIDSTEKQKFLEDLKAPLLKAHQKSKGTVLRRLNRQEYQNTLNDLFGTHLDLVNIFPEDGRSHEFNNVGESLSLSMVQLKEYLNAIDWVMETAIEKTVKQPEVILKKANYADTREGKTHIGKAWKQLEDGAVVFFRPLGYPTGMLRTANTRKSGWYNIRVKGYAYQSSKPVTFAIGATTFKRGAQKPTFTYRQLPPGEPKTVEVKAWIEKNYMVEITPWGINDDNYEIKKVGINNYKGPGLAILEVELEGPLLPSFPSRGHELIFKGLKREEIEPRNPREKEKSWYKPKFHIVSDSPQVEVEKVLNRIATTAFRRPVEKHEIEAYLKLFNEELESGEMFEESLKTAIAALFCSPDFIFLKEPAGELNDFALAARLSYFLVRTTPDPELLKSAHEGELNDSKVILKHTERLLKDPRHERFIKDFTDAWLNLRDIEFTTPDKSLYPEFDSYLQWSMLRETRQFFASLIENNEPVINYVKSDYALINERLAQHYGIDNVQGPKFQKVKLTPGNVRGGLLSQASVLKVSANGTNTSPVTRGVWVMERILGEVPKPPPPGVPGVEPDIRGASTLREILKKHRSVASCNSCHRKIDPPGFALEGFNPIGGLREAYRSLGEGKKLNLRINGRKVRYRIGLPVDSSGQFADGQEFKNFNEFRNHLIKDQKTLARTLVTKLLTFSTGREMGFSDREPIEKLLLKAEKDSYRIQDLIRLVVTSDLFRTK